jgi:mono/diheme cytochrome c family protein
MVAKTLPGIAILLTMLFVEAVHFPVPGSAQGKKPARATPPSADSGEQLYKSYCADCHGNDLKGNRRISSEYKNPPADLTTLAQRHKGEFPEAYVENVLRNGVNKPPHGNTEMPVWGIVFAPGKDANPQLVTTRILNLTNYIKSLQAKPEADVPSF